MDLRDRGLRSPIPFAPRTSYAFARSLTRSTRKSEANSLLVAKDTWVGGKRGQADRADVWVTRLHGPAAPLAVLTDGLTDDERWPGPAEYAGALTSRLAHYAMRVWAPALAEGIDRG